MKRLLSKGCVLLSIGLCMLLAAPKVEAAAFSDVSEREQGWAVSSIYLMADKGILTGYPDGTFQPNKDITKAEWTAMVYRLFDKYRPNLKAPKLQQVDGFTDVPPGHWAYREILEIYDYTFDIGAFGMNASGQLSFRPDEPLTRLQLAQMLYGFFDNRLMNRRISENDVCSVVSSFTDVPVQSFEDAAGYDLYRKNDGRNAANGSITDVNNELFKTLFLTKENSCSFGSDEYSNKIATALASLHASGIMTANESGGFRPLDKLSRAEAVTILNRIYNFLNRNFWLTDYTTIDLDSSGTAAGAGSSGSSGSGSGGTAIGSGSVIGAGSGGYNYNAGSIGSGSGLTIRDYFDDKGVIKKDVMKYGGPETPIETAVEIGNNRYLTIDLKSAEKNNLTIFFFDGNQAHVKQDELPITIKVEGYRVIGIKSALSEPNVNKQTDYSATLSVSLSQVEPEKPPKKKK